MNHQKNKLVFEPKMTGKDLNFMGDKPLSEINGEIRRMDREKLKNKLKILALSEIGTKPVLIKRLQNHYKKIFVREQMGPEYCEKWISCKYFVSIDFEATCVEENGANYPHEIIEFPAVLVDVESGKTISKFHSFVRPRINPLLSNFCMDLTGIRQDQVDSAPYFPVVFKLFKQWLVEHNLLSRLINNPDKLKIDDSVPSWTFVTDGSADICRFLYLQCSHDHISFPYHWAGRYSNLKKIFNNAYKGSRSIMKLESMLEYLGMEFEGRLHSGIDDAINIARISISLTKDGHDLWQNEEFKNGCQSNLSHPKHIYQNISNIQSIHNKRHNENNILIEKMKNLKT